MERAYSTRLAPGTVDAIILAGPRLARRPVEEAAIADLGDIRYRTLPRERQESLLRLIARGLVSRRVERSPDPRWPLIACRETTVYQATEGGDHGSR